MLKRLEKHKFTVPEEDAAKLSFRTDAGWHTVQELTEKHLVEIVPLKSPAVAIKVTPKGAAAMVDYRHCIGKERRDRAFNFLSGVAVGLVSGVAVSLFSFWLAANFIPWGAKPEHKPKVATPAGQ